MTDSNDEHDIELILRRYRPLSPRADLWPLQSQSSRWPYILAASLLFTTFLLRTWAAEGITSAMPAATISYNVMPAQLQVTTEAWQSMIPMFLSNDACIRCDDDLFLSPLSPVQ